MTNISKLDDGSLDADVFDGHAIGCNAVSWAPAVLPGSLIVPQAPAPTPAPGPGPGPQNATGQTSPGGLATVRRFASAGCDNVVRIWAYNDATRGWVEEDVLTGHTDWVRDVAWAPNVGLPRAYLATASQDRTVLVWTKDAPGAPWVKTALDPAAASVGGAGAGAGAGAGTGAGTGATPAQPGKFPDVVWRVSWSLAGNILAVSCGDGKVTLWKENLKGVWECVNELAS